MIVCWRTFLMWLGCLMIYSSMRVWLCHQFLQVVTTCWVRRRRMVRWDWVLMAGLVMMNFTWGRLMMVHWSSMLMY